MATKVSRYVVAAAVGLCLICQSVLAAPVTVQQDFGFNNIGQGFVPFLLTATIQFDNGDLQGVGQEFIVLDSVRIAFRMRDFSDLSSNGRRGRILLAGGMSVDCQR